MKQIPFSPPYINESVRRHVDEVLSSGWITTGPKCLELEKQVSKVLRVENVVTCNSWSSGAQIVLRSLGIGEGDEVIIPNYTYAATLLAVHHIGAKPIIVDVDENYQIDLKEIQKAITSRTKAIIPVDIGGLPVNVPEILRITQEMCNIYIPDSPFQKKLKRIAVICDAAHSFGAEISNEKVGGQADFTIFSLHAVKNLTSAEGGLVTFNNHEWNVGIEQEIRLNRLNGQTKDAFSKTQGLANWEYDIALKGFKMNMPDICAAIALGQLEDYENIINERQRVFDRYEFNFRKSGHFKFLPTSLDNRKSSNHLFMISLNSELVKYRNSIINFAAEQGVSTNVHFKPLSYMTAFANEKKCGKLENSINLFEREISLPIYPQLTDLEVDYICSVIETAILNFSKNDRIPKNRM